MFVTQQRLLALQLWGVAATAGKLWRQRVRSGSVRRTLQVACASCSPSVQLLPGALLCVLFLPRISAARQGWLLAALMSAAAAAQGHSQLAAGGPQPGSRCAAQETPSDGMHLQHHCRDASRAVSMLPLQQVREAQSSNVAVRMSTSC